LIAFIAAIRSTSDSWPTGTKPNNPNEQGKSVADMVGEMTDHMVQHRMGDPSEASSSFEFSVYRGIDPDGGFVP
jgi:hypothetical protein